MASWKVQHEHLAKLRTPPEHTETDSKIACPVSVPDVKRNCQRPCLRLKASCGPWKMHPSQRTSNHRDVYYCLLLMGREIRLQSLESTKLLRSKFHFFSLCYFLESTHLRRKINSLLLHCWHWNERVHVDINLVVEIQRVDHGNVLLCRE